MEPDAFAWVHATLAASVVEGHRLFTTPMTAAEKEAFWQQWLDVGRLVGVRERDLPADWAGFEAYFADTIATRLQWTPAVPEVLDTLSRPMPPDVPGLRPGLWRVLRAPMSLQLRVMTTGLLPRDLRHRLGLRWTRNDKATFRALARASRMAGPAIRGPLAEFGPRYVHYRRDALARGDVASGSADRRRDAA
jgi:uncharacterized protein (DUF2236 family)